MAYSRMTVAELNYRKAFKRTRALVYTLSDDKGQARQRLANLMATCVARKASRKFSYWPKVPRTMLDLLA